MSQGKPRDTRKEQQWRRWIGQWQHSGLTIRAFCERHHLSQPSFYAWRSCAIQQRDAVTSTLVSVQPRPRRRARRRKHRFRGRSPRRPGHCKRAAALRCGKSAATAARAPGGLLVLNFPPAVRIWLGSQPVDLRRSFDGLAEQVRQHLRADPLSGHIFVFRNKRGDRLQAVSTGMRTASSSSTSGSKGAPSAGRRHSAGPAEHQTASGRTDHAALRH